MGTDDLFKRRVRGKKDFGRKKANKDFKNNILIICEGECTEKNYLEHLTSNFGIKNITFKTGFGSRKTDMIKTAKENSDYFKHIFCIIDKDTIENLKKYEKKVKEIKNLDKNHNVTLIVSNPCFEYWILLHFENTRKNYDCNSSPCNQLIEKCLKKHIAGYEKNYNFKNIVDDYKTAYKNAKSLQDEDGSYTRMPILIDYLENLKSNNK